MTNPISGAQFELVHGEYAATIASVGASIRSLTHAGRDLVVPYGADEMRPAFRGVTLAPWPNRVVDGRYSFGGQDFKLGLSEHDRGHALHGLLVWSDYALIERGDDFVSLEATVEAQFGYPFRVAVRVDYRLDSDGLHQSVTGTNTGLDAAPFGTGPHPYLVAGPGNVDDWTLHLPCELVLEVTDDRLIPTGTAQVAGTAFDFQSPTTIGDVFIDHAFTGFSESRVTVTAPGGTGVAITWDTACTWVQVHTADNPEPALSRLGLAVEPMTCPPDAFNSGTDLIVLQPGDSSTASWAISAL